MSQEILKASKIIFAVQSSSTNVFIVDEGLLRAFYMLLCLQFFASSDQSGAVEGVFN